MTRLALLLLALVSLAQSSCGVLEDAWLHEYRERGGYYDTPHTPKRATSTQDFKQPLIVPILYAGAEQYQLARPWDRHGHQVPVGLVIDGASVPRCCWPFMPPDGAHRAGALWHDWLYINRGALPDGYAYTRLDADHEFYNLMLEAGLSPTRAGIAYRAVRAFGWHAWDSIEEPTILPVTNAVPHETRRRFRLFAHLYAP